MQYSGLQRKNTISPTIIEELQYEISWQAAGCSYTPTTMLHPVMTESHCTWLA